jgi:pyrroline-5-carboxylate reductase
MKVSFIGGGNMAVAMVSGMLQQGFQAQEIHIVEPNEEKRTALASQYKVEVADPSQPLPDSDVVILAVKPQQVVEVLKNRGHSLQNSMLMSIAAGVSIKALQILCGKAQRIVRVMPNTPALIGAGISGAFASTNIEAADKILAEHILQAMGEVVWVDEESALDSITAVSGSGPAYVFYFIEALQQAAQNQGFDLDTARKLAYATFNGAVRLAQSSPESVNALRARVTSKKGTTEEGVAVLEQHQLLHTVDEAVKAAAERSRALEQELIKSLKR